MSAMFIELAAVLGFIGGVALLLGSFEPRYVRLEKRSGRCLRCRYSREGLASDAACPECGASWQDSTIVVKRRTRPSLRAAGNIVASMVAVVLLPAVLAILWYGLCRAGGYPHSKAWRLSMYPAEFQEYGNLSDSIALLCGGVTVALWAAVWTQVRFGSRAFRRQWKWEFAVIVWLACGAVLLAWFADLRTWTSIAGIDFLRSNRHFGLLIAVVNSFVLAVFWRSFRRNEDRNIAHLRANPDGPSRVWAA